jgi:hypothetical protein
VSTFFDVDHTLVFSDHHTNARIIDGDRYLVEKYGRDRVAGTRRSIPTAGSSRCTVQAGASRACPGGRR